MPVRVAGSNPVGPTTSNGENLDLTRINKEEKSWLIGLFLADGWKGKEIRTYRTYFYLNNLKDSEIFKKLKQILEKGSVRYAVYLQRRNTLRIRISNKAFLEFMPDKKSEVYIPQNVEAFVAGFIDGDGYIDIKAKTIGFSQTTVKWIGPYISKYLKSKGVLPSKNLVYRNCFYYRAPLKSVIAKTDILNFMARREKAEVSTFVESMAQPSRAPDS